MQTNEETYKDQIAIAWKEYKNNEHAKAKEICIQMKKEFPDKLGPNFLLGVIYFDNKDYEVSISELRLAFTKDVDKKSGGYINYFLGLNYGDESFLSEKNNPIYNKDLSRISFEKAIEYETYPEDVIFKLSSIYQNTFKLIQLYKKAIIKFPDNVNFYLDLSYAYEKAEKLEEKRKILLTASKKFKSSHILFELGEFYLKSKNIQKARDCFESALKLNKIKNSDFALQVKIAFTFKAEKDIEIAKKYYKEAFINEKNNNNFWFGLIGILMCEKKSNFSDFNSLLDDMEITSQFIIDDWFGDMPIYLDSQRAFGIDLGFEISDIIKQLDLFVNTQKKDDTIGKVALIKSALYKHSGDKQNRLSSLKVAKEHLNTYYYEFILSELANAFYELFYYLVEENKSIEKISKDLIFDLKNEYSLREAFVDSLETIIEDLFKQKKYNEIIELYELFTKQQIEKVDIWFEVGYSFNELGNFEKAKYAYNRYIEINGETSAVLNNLANIYKRENKLKVAIDMYQRALKIDNNDDFVKGNLENAIKHQKELSIEENKKKAIDKLFLGALGLLKSENYFALETLHSFVLNIKKEEEFEDWIIPIQEEMFPVFMNTSLKKAIELKENWLSKNYIVLSDETDEYDIPYYRINPYIEEEIIKLRSIVSETEFPKEWSKGLNNISTFQLEEIEYSSTVARINKINIKFKPLILRDYNELVLNYLLGNRKSIVVLSGSFVELILTYYCEKKRIRKISYTNSTGKLITKNLYDCVLFDLISYIEENKYFGNDFFPLSNLSRVYRNLVHPGVEISNSLDKTKSDLCFISALEILRKII